MKAYIQKFFFVKKYISNAAIIGIIIIPIKLPKKDPSTAGSKIPLT